MMHPLLATTLAALCFLPALPAQQAGGPDADRMSSSAVVSSDDFKTLACVYINYSRPTWQDGYEAMLDQKSGSNYMRLGNGWWTTLDTIGALEIGGQHVDAGSYYLGLVTDKDGAFSLLLFDSKAAMQAALMPAKTALYTGEAKADLRAPLTLVRGALKEAALKLEIEITADKANPGAGRFSIRWGKHELSAPVKFLLAGAKDAPAPKK